MRRVAVWIFLGCCLAGSIATGAELQGYEQTFQQLSKALETCRASSAEQVGYDAGFGRDPMGPLVDAQGQIAVPLGLRGGHALQGIIWTHGAPMVLIDGELYREGDALGPYTIREIQEKGFFAVRGKNRQWIPLNP